MLMHDYLIAAMEYFLKQHDLSLSTEDLTSFFTAPEKIEFRNIHAGMIIGGGESLLPSEWLYKNFLKKDQKREIFSSRYELGHPDSITKEEKSEELFFNYLESKYGGADVPGLIKKIKKNIRELTGTPFKCFIEYDRDTAYKVLALCYRICRQHKTQLFSFLRKKTDTKPEFEFRSGAPYVSPVASQNSAILSELLSFLSFAMTEEELAIAKAIPFLLSSVGNDISCIIREYALPCNYSQDTIHSVLNELLQPKPSITPGSQLAFRFSAALLLQEYSIRATSNKILANFAQSLPVNMKTLRKAKLKSFSDKHVLSHILGYNVEEIRPTLKIEANFIERIILHYLAAKSSTVITKLPTMNLQIIMAMILHDEKLKIKIPSKVKGENNTPQSVTSILKQAIKFSENNPGSFPPLTHFPEALTMYWEIRYNLLNNVLFKKNMNSYIQKQRSLAELELLIDTKLTDFLLFQDASAFHILDKLPLKFLQTLTD